MPQYRANFKMANSDQHRRNSLGLDADRLNQLLDILDRNAEEDSTLRRVYVRWPFRQESIVFRAIENLGSKREFRVAARNLSNGGVSLIHNAYVYPGTECEVDLPLAGEDGVVTMVGEVKRCTHIHGVVHELGVSFRDQLDSRKFLSADSMPAYYSLEMIEPEKLEGTLLHIDDSALDRRLLAHYLSDTRVIIKSASTYAEGVEKAHETYDLIVLDNALPDGDGANLAQELRELGVMTPIIVLTADSSPHTTAALQKAEVNAVLIKPVEQDTLLRAITEFLGLHDDSAGGADSAMSGLKETFIAELTPMMERIKKACEDDKPMDVYSVVMRIKGTAPSLGFDRLANIADRTAAVLAGSMSIAESSRQIDTLLAACERAKHRRAG